MIKASSSPVPPVEDLDELAWSRVERGVWSRLDGGAAARAPERRRSWVTPALLVAAAAAAMIVALLAWPQRPPAQALAIAPDRFVSGAASSSVSAGDVFVVLDAASAVTIARDPSPQLAVVESGAVSFTVAPRPRTRPFLVSAGDVTVRVVGTQFRVAHSGEVVAVTVERGVVEVTYRGTHATLRAGASWRTPQVASAGPLAPLAPSLSPSVPTAPPHVPVPTAPTAPTAPTEQARFRRLTALEATDPDAAIAGYLTLARGTSRWSELALFAASRLAVDRGDPRAPGLLISYLHRFPRGANADDARELISQLHGVTP